FPITADQVVPRVESDLSSPPEQTVDRSLGLRLRRFLSALPHGPRAAGRAGPRKGPDDGRLVGVVAERGSQLDDEVRQIRFRDVDAGPETLVDVGLRNGTGTRLDEKLEERERLRRSE